MKLKERLGLCGTRFHFGRSVVTMTVNGITKEGERVFLKEQSMCKKCFQKSFDASLKDSNKVKLEYADGSTLFLEGAKEDEE